MLSFIQCMCAQATPTSMQFVLVSGATEYPWFTALYAGAWEIHKQFEKVLYDEDEIVRINWIATLAGTDVYGWMFGYLIKKY